MYKIVPYNESIDLTEFYKEAHQRELHNNSTKKMLFDSISNEPEWQVWILYYNNEIVGTTAAHTLDIMGDNCYRIAARSCVFTDKLPQTSLRTLTGIKEHQNATAQFLIPICIEWQPYANLYITSNEHEQGTQRQVHRIFCPALEKTGALNKVAEKEYRGHKQTFWEVNVDVYYRQLDEFGRWPIEGLV